MGAWWANLNDRERLLVGGGLACVLVVLLYVSLLEPLSQRRASIEARVAAEQRVLTKLEDQAREAAALRAQVLAQADNAQTQEQSFLSVINESAARHQLRRDVRRIVPNGSNEATIAFDSVPFDRLVAWLVELQTDFGVGVLRLNLDRIHDRTGVVRANLSLAR